MTYWILGMTDCLVINSLPTSVHCRLLIAFANDQNVGPGLDPNCFT